VCINCFELEQAAINVSLYMVTYGRGSSMMYTMSSACSKVQPANENYCLLVRHAAFTDYDILEEYFTSAPPMIVVVIITVRTICNQSGVLGNKICLDLNFCLVHFVS
jgi:hypothetical protein